MISAANFSNLETLRRACLNDDLALYATRILETQEPVALVAAIQRDGEYFVVTPLGLLRNCLPPVLGVQPVFLDESGHLTDATKSAFTELQKSLKSEKHQPWFQEDSLGHVTVAFAELGTVGNPDNAVLTLPWGNPYEMFEDPCVALAQQATASKDL